MERTDINDFKWKVLKLNVNNWVSKRTYMEKGYLQKIIQTMKFIIKYNKNYNKHTYKPATANLIENFDPVLF